MQCGCTSGVQCYEDLHRSERLYYEVLASRRHTFLMFCTKIEKFKKKSIFFHTTVKLKPEAFWVYS